MDPIEIQRLDNGVFRLTARMWVPLPPEEVFDFFADAHNLETITPHLLRFEVLTPKPIDMHVGTLIDYRLKLHGIPIRWRTKITGWDPPHSFEDSQLKGPYRQWIHTHTFQPLDRGTQCNDRVDYRVPGGALIEKLFVRNDVRKIFEYRQAKLAEHFGSAADAPPPARPKETSQNG